MTRKEALAELIAKVEAGTLVTVDLIIHEPQERAWAQRAYGGSLDAAKALHEAVLPGWVWGCGFDGDDGFGAGVANGGREFVVHGGADNPARAWLLAILHALHSMEPDA